MRVLIIPEDFRKDQYMLKPIITRMMVAIDRPTAKVRVCTDPLLGGVSQATNWERLNEILDEYSGMVDVFLLLIDRDGEANRRASLDGLEANAAEAYPDRIFLAEQAWQEIEVWVLAGLDSLPGDWAWQQVRNEQHPKEVYYEPLAAARELLDQPAEGRKQLTLEGTYARLRSRCPEIGGLEARLRIAIAA